MARNRRRRKDLADNRRSVPFFPAAGPGRHDQADLHMLREDIHHKIIPLGGRSRRWPDYRASVVPAGDETSELILDALALEEREYDMTSAFGAFVRRTVDLILHQGEAFYEVVYDREKDPEAFLFAPLPPGEYRVFEGTFTQILPPAVQTARGLSRPFVELPEEDIIRISFPDSLGGKDAVLMLLDAFESMGNSILPGFAGTDFAGFSREFGLQVGVEYREMREVALARATSALGWDTRSLLDGKITQFYRYHRMLKFSLSMARLREHFLERLNAALIPPMGRVGIEGSIVVEGLPTAATFEAKIAELASGELPFNQVFDLLWMN